MRYGDERLYRTGKLNVLQFINTKRKCFEGEREVRAILWCSDLFAGKNRHLDINNIAHSRPLPENPLHHWVHCSKRRRIDLTKLITGIVVSPWAAKETFDAVGQWVRVKNHAFEVRRSNLAI
jgi:hypothetical protein